MALADWPCELQLYLLAKYGHFLQVGSLLVFGYLQDTGLSPFWTLVHVSLLSVGALMGSAGVFVGMAIVGFSNTLDSAQQLWSCIAVGKQAELSAVCIL